MFCDIYRKSSLKKYTKKASEDKIDDSVEPFINDYFNSNRYYFESLLGERVSRKKNLSKNDLIILKEAYEKSHQIKNLELDLYWKRATYCWSLVAALITTCGLLFSIYLKPENVNDRNEGILIFIGAISIVGVTITIISSLISSSGEYWKKNWESHVSMLEPLFSGRIYSTHLVPGRYRHSISRLNKLLFYVVISCWIMIVELLIFIKLGSRDDLFYSSIFSLFLFFFLIIFIIYKFTASKNKDTEFLITGYRITVNKELKPLPYIIWKSISGIISELSVALFTLIILYLCIFIISKYGMKIIFPSPLELLEGIASDIKNVFNEK
ncbi:RipA family octameric membrane protein [Pectobacterium odoriferum]|uniref:RipA family octameric membrane protein n=1 Tax=Pectobacterium odoriferum TaxID=78398 RepID=UPI000CD05827|nr:hypothetical protein [Pectobacterium odoriferum]POD96414.1 hypothetical protein BVY06_08720 [Pectobacterium odoriferum]